LQPGGLHRAEPCGVHCKMWALSPWCAGWRQAALCAVPERLRRTHDLAAFRRPAIGKSEKPAYRGAVAAQVFQTGSDQDGRRLGYGRRARSASVQYIRREPIHFRLVAHRSTNINSTRLPCDGDRRASQSLLSDALDEEHTQRSQGGNGSASFANERRAALVRRGARKRWRWIRERLARAKTPSMDDEQGIWAQSRIPWRSRPRPKPMALPGYRLLRRLCRWSISLCEPYILSADRRSSKADYGRDREQRQ